MAQDKVFQLKHLLWGKLTKLHSASPHFEGTGTQSLWYFLIRNGFKRHLVQMKIIAYQEDVQLRGFMLLAIRNHVAKGEAPSADIYDLSYFVILGPDCSVSTILGKESLMLPSLDDFNPSHQHFHLPMKWAAETSPYEGPKR